MNYTDNTLDSRDIIARHEELEAEREQLIDEQDEAQEAVTDQSAASDAEIDDLNDACIAAQAALATFDREYGSELEMLNTVCTEGEGYVADWSYGEQLISEDYFETYAQELAEDCGTIDRDQPWPLNHIDWEAAADALKDDYIELDIDGNTYFARG